VNTIVKNTKREVIIGYERPTVIIGERINPTGRKKFSAELEAGNLDMVRHDAIAQDEVGADILDVNVGVSGLDEISMLPRAVEIIVASVDTPLCFDSNNPKALRAALEMYEGRPLINSVTGEERSLSEVLPLVKEYDVPVIGLTISDAGIPDDIDTRIEIAHKIIERAEVLGIDRSNIVIDCLAMAVGADGNAGKLALEVIRRIHVELGVNQTLGASNISFGLPQRGLVNNAFIAQAIEAGVTCPIANVSKLRAAIFATDLVLGTDKYARRYSKYCRSLDSSAIPAN
jgi:5-methyltetrahydrofolate--homocysteine methyltransferase